MERNINVTDWVLHGTCFILCFGSEVENEKWVLSYMSKDFLHFFLIFLQNLMIFQCSGGGGVVDVSPAVHTAACAGQGVQVQLLMNEVFSICQKIQNSYFFWRKCRLNWTYPPYKK